MLYVFFWVIPRRLNFICRRFGTLCLFHLRRQVGKEWPNLRMVGVPIWERVWLKNNLSQLEGGWRGRGGSGYKAGCESLMTHMEVAGGYVKQIWFVSGWAKGWQVKNYCVVGGCLLSHTDTPTILKFSHFLPTCLWRWNRQSVPKRRHIKFRRRGITQKKTYNIQNTVKVWNQEKLSSSYAVFVVPYVIVHIKTL